MSDDKQDPIGQDDNSRYINIYMMTKRTHGAEDIADDYDDDDRWIKCSVNEFLRSRLLVLSRISVCKQEIKENFSLTKQNETERSECGPVRQAV